jgi:chromosome segregation ATPase
MASEPLIRNERGAFVPPSVILAELEAAGVTPEQCMALRTAKRHSEQKEADQRALATALRLQSEDLEQKNETLRAELQKLKHQNEGLNMELATLRKGLEVKSAEHQQAQTELTALRDLYKKTQEFAREIHMGQARKALYHPDLTDYGAIQSAIMAAEWTVFDMIKWAKEMNKESIVADFYEFAIDYFHSARPL